MKKSILGGVVAVALVAAASNTAKATTYSAAYSPGDVLLGFYDANTTTNAGGEQFVIDLGSFNPTSSFTLSNTVSHIGSDLALAFGSSWYSDANLYFGAAGGSSSDLLLTNPNTAAFYESAGYAASVSVLGNIGGDINQQPQVTNQLSTGLIFPNSASYGWDGYGETLNSAYSGTAGDTGIDNNITDSLNLDQLVDHTGGSRVKGSVAGAFSIDSAGDITYTAAVPEPSTYAAVAIGAAVLLFARRRRSVA